MARMIETNEMEPLAFLYGEDVKPGDTVVVWAHEGESAGLVEAQTVKRVYRVVGDAEDVIVSRFTAAKAVVVDGG